MIICGDIGEDQREWEFEPLGIPAPAELPEEAPAEPEKEPVPA